MKAAVLPLPVIAQARRSLPARAGGIASFWIGVGREAQLLDAAEEVGVETEGREGHSSSLSGGPRPRKPPS